MKKIYAPKIFLKNKKKRRLKFFLFGALFCVFLAACLYIIFSSKLQISNVVVSGSDKVSALDIENAVLELMDEKKYKIFPRSNAIFVDKDYLENQILGEFSRLQFVDIKRNGANTLNVSVKERLPLYLWCNENECFHVDSAGIIFDFADYGEMENKIVFKTDIGQGGVLGASVADKVSLSNFFKSIDFFSEKDIAIKFINMESESKMEVGTSIGKIIMNPQDEDISKTLENILLLYEDQKKKIGGGIIFEYVDARFGNKLFFKTVEP